MQSSTERAQKHSQPLRAIEMWVPDTRQPGFADECRRQSRLLRDDPGEADTMDWLDHAADRDGWR
ncbi:antitoxin MazE family protein [Thiohalocapsa sp. ML1]|uniref:antitoxin MazE family protein n=1 Tax=Thiohalocapsa sp. ML1 TaxID=1431688 RepID=UPI0009E77993|nr:antitoxin MazE family protein [Thiohalocapsa sp. ML1]